ncbi:MAG: leucine-rich repeat domain-containing protein [Ruminococcus sp.]|nr:leucine-rich repeat domain-containing protein [Ruminococcus sp.]
MKKVFSTVMATAICSSFVCSNLADTGLDFINAEEYHNALEWQDVYADTLKDYISSGVAKTAKFSLCYVDEDDIPELVVHSNGMAYHADTEVFLYTFYNGEVKNLGQISNDGYSNFTYYEKTGVVISGWLNQGLDYRVINKLSDGEINVEHTFFSNEAAVASGGYSEFDDVRSDDAYEKYEASLPDTDPIHDTGEYALTEENINLYLSDNSGNNSDIGLSDIIDIECTYYADWFEGDGVAIARYITTLKFEDNSVKIVNAPTLGFPTHTSFEIGKMTSDNVFRLVSGKIQSGNNYPQENVEGTLTVINDTTIKVEYNGTSTTFISSANPQFKDTSEKVASGKCGDNAFWELNSEGIFRVYGKGDMENYIEPDDNPWKSQKEYIKKVVIEEGITSIGFWTFSACENLKDVIISNSVNSIQYGAFSGSGIEKIDIPSNVKSINSFAFANCTSLKSLDLPCSFAHDAFTGCTGLESVIISENSTTISDGAFSKCTGLKNITIPDSVKSIENWAFSECTSLESITIPSSVTDIRWQSFMNCTKLTDVYYTGTEDEWNSINIGDENECLTNAEIHFNAGELSESELKAKVEKYGNVSVWEYHDYDGNGTNEAFAVITDENNSDKKPDVYFIDTYGTVTSMPAGFNGFYYENTGKYFTTEGKGFFSFDIGASGSGWDTLLYSVKNNVPYELDIAREIQGFYQNTETGGFYTTLNDFSSGHHEWPEYELIYDSDSQQFSIGERLDGVVSEDVTSGKCGDNADWNFDKSTGILTISGSGKMYDYATIISEMPWKLYNNQIKRVVVEKGITEFYFNYNQKNQPNLDSFVIAESVSLISGISADIDYTLVREVTIYGYTGTEAEVYVKKHNDYIKENYSEEDKAKFKDKVKFYPLNGQLLAYVSCPDSMVVSNKNGSYDKNTISVSFTVANAGNYDLSEVFVNLNLPDGVRCNDADKHLKFSLGKNKERTFDITLYLSNKVLDSNDIVTFSAEVGASDETNTNSATKYIISVVSTPAENIPKSFNIIHKDLINNELSSEDVFKFLNYSGDFFNKNDDKIYQLSDSSLNKLLNAFDDNIVKVYVKTKRTKDGWYGSCHGMSTVVSLVKSGYMNLTGFGLNSDISKLDSPKKDAKVEDLINFYQLQQFLPYHQYNKNNSQLVDENEKLKEIVQETKKTSQGGLPVRINYYYEGTKKENNEQTSGGHAVVGYKCECVAEMDWLGKHRVVSDENDPDFHEYRITIYDCSQTIAGLLYTPTYMYIGKDYNYWWYEPVHGEINLTEANIKTVSSSSEELNLVDYKTGKKSSMCLEHFDTNFLSYYAKESNVHISTSEGSSELSGLGEGEGNLYTYTVPDVGTIYDEDGNIISSDSYTTYFDDNFKDEDITIKLDNTGECDFSMIYTNCMVSAGGNKVSKVDMKSAGAVDLIADNSDYELSLTFNEGYYNMPWYTITASGDKANDVSMKQTENGIVFNSDNMENVTITANNTGEIVELTFTADTDNILITNNKNALEVYSDNDNNGTYETLVKTTSINNNSNNTSSNNKGAPNTGDSIPKVFTLLATAVFGVVILRKRNKDNKI